MEVWRKDDPNTPGVNLVRGTALGELARATGRAWPVVADAVSLLERDALTLLLGWT
jgi:hypothetical protein